MPVSVRRVVQHADLTERMATYAVRTSADSRPSPETVEGDVLLLDDTGRVLVELVGVRVQRVGRSATRPQHPEKGILVFDIYGTYNKTIPVTKLHHFQISNDLIIYFKDGKLNSYNMKTLEEGKISFPESQPLDARTEKEKLYLLKEKSLDIYNVTNEK